MLGIAGGSGNDPMSVMVFKYNPTGMAHVKHAVTLIRPPTVVIDRGHELRTTHDALRYPSHLGPQEVPEEFS